MDQFEWNNDDCFIILKQETLKADFEKLSSHDIRVTVRRSHGKEQQAASKYCEWPLMDSQQQNGDLSPTTIRR